MACVSFATDNQGEIQIKHQTGFETNLADRFLAKVSGTTQQGNRVSTVLDALKLYGNVAEAVWPVPALPVTWDNYYSEITPAGVFTEALKFKVSYDLQYEYHTDHSPENVRRQLQHAPLLITIPGHEITGLYLEPDNQTLWILDDYIFNVDPNQPFLRTIKLSDVTDIFKAVLTVRNNMPQIKSIDVDGEEGIFLAASDMNDLTVLCKMFGKDPKNIEVKATKKP